MTTVEFALVAPVLLATVFFMLGMCLVLWTAAAIQTAASQLARCSAIGSSACSNQTTYVTNILTAWGVNNIFPNPSVNVTSGSTCSGTVGHYSLASVSGAGYSALFLTIPAKTLTATACFPSSAS